LGHRCISCHTRMVASARLCRRASGSREPSRLSASRPTPSIPAARKTKETWATVQAVSGRPTKPAVCPLKACPTMAFSVSNVVRVLSARPSLQVSGRPWTRAAPVQPRAPTNFPWPGLLKSPSSRPAPMGGGHSSRNKFAGPRSRFRGIVSRPIIPCDDRNDSSGQDHFDAPMMPSLCFCRRGAP